MLFLFIFVVFNNFLINPVDNENARLKLALAISTDAPITIAKKCNRNATTCCR